MYCMKFVSVVDLSAWQQKLDSDVQDVLDEEEEEEEEEEEDDIVAPVISKVTSTGIIFITCPS